jgi:pilus assembly protein CpaB
MMGTRRTTVILAAVVVGIVAGLAVYQYLTTVQERANNDARLVKVFVVKRDIVKGTPGERALEAAWIRSDQINLKFRPVTAVVDINVIRGRVAVTDLAAHQVVVERQFVDPTVGLVTSAGRIPAGQVAITLSFDEVTGVAGLIQPGDKVNMLLLLGPEERYLLQNVNVLFVGKKPAPQPGETQPPNQPAEEMRSGLITFAVSPENAARIAFANARGQGSVIHLTLVPPDNKPVPVPSMNDENLIASPTQTG